VRDTAEDQTSRHTNYPEPLLFASQPLATLRNLFTFNSGDTLRHFVGIAPFSGRRFLVGGFWSAVSGRRFLKRSRRTSVPSLAG